MKSESELRTFRLCSSYDEVHALSCDLLEGHHGEHKATVYWRSDDHED